MDESSHSLSGKAWALLRADKYEEAIAAYTLCFRESKDFVYIYNRGQVYLEAGDYEAALQDFELATNGHEPQFLADAIYIYQGISHWYLERPLAAMEVWQRALTAPYTDAVGGVKVPALLLYGATSLKHPEYEKIALDLLKKFSRGPVRAWPGPIVPYLLGKMKTDALLERIRTVSEPILRDRWQCQADFYIGVRSLRQELCPSSNKR